MSKRFFAFLLILAIMFVMSAGLPLENAATANNDIITEEFEEELKTEPIPDGVLKARFENMLNHNFVYGEDFYSDKTVIENSVLALLDKQVDGEIDRGLVVGFIADLYGRQVDTDTVVYDFCPATEGMIAIIPRGYTEYEHNILSITEGVGGYDVVSQVRVYPHDGESYVATATTVIVPNEGSSFGYNIVSSVIA